MFDEIVAILKGHFEPKSLLVVKRFHFNQCNQKQNQTVAHYVAELKHLVKTWTQHYEIGSSVE